MEAGHRNWKVELRQTENGRIKLKRPGGCNEKCRERGDGVEIQKYGR